MHRPGHIRTPTAGPRELQKQQHMEPPRIPTKEIPKEREMFNTIARPGLIVYAALRTLSPLSPPARGSPPLLLFFSPFLFFLCLYILVFVYIFIFMFIFLFFIHAYKLL